MIIIGRFIRPSFSFFSMEVWVNSFYQIYSDFLSVLYDKILSFCDIGYVQFIGFFCVSVALLYDFYSIIVFFYDIRSYGRAGDRFQFNNITNDNRYQDKSYSRGESYYQTTNTGSVTYEKNIDKSINYNGGDDD